MASLPFPKSLPDFKMVTIRYTMVNGREATSVVFAGEALDCAAYLAKHGNVILAIEDPADAL